MFSSVYISYNIIYPLARLPRRLKIPVCNIITKNLAGGNLWDTSLNNSTRWFPSRVLYKGVFDLLRYFEGFLSLFCHAFAGQLPRGIGQICMSPTLQDLGLSVPGKSHLGSHTIFGPVSHTEGGEEVMGVRRTHPHIVHNGGRSSFCVRKPFRFSSNNHWYFHSLRETKATDKEIQKYRSRSRYL